jgi:uncharacterized protein YqeY
MLSVYLPEQLSEDEIRSLIDEAISATGASQMSHMGKVMGILSSKIKGKADGGMVSSIVREKLGA